jgi:hypothetical protein
VVLLLDLALKQGMVYYSNEALARLFDCTSWITLCGLGAGLAMVAANRKALSAAALPGLPPTQRDSQGADTRLGQRWQQKVGVALCWLHTLYIGAVSG